MNYHIKTINPNAIKELKIRTMFTSYKLMVDDVVVEGNGIVGESQDVYFPEYKPLISFFKVDQNEFEIILQIANSSNAYGGIRYPIYMGFDYQIIALQKKAQQKDIFILGAVFTMALYHGAIFFLQRRYHYKAELYFMLLMVLSFISIAFRDEYVILNFFLRYPSIRL